MAFESLPLTIREVRASEDVLKRIYDAARKGLRGDTLARAAGLAPIEYRRLVELDPLTEEAAGWGYADAEFAAATAIQTAIDAGDAKIALDFLKHRSDWTATQKITIEGDISFKLVLDELEEKAKMIDAQPVTSGVERLTSNQTQLGASYERINTSIPDSASPIYPPRRRVRPPSTAS